MTLFTENPLEKMMVQRPTGRLKMPKALTIKSFGIFSYVRKRTGNSTRGGNFCESIIF